MYKETKVKGPKGFCIICFRRRGKKVPVYTGPDADDYEVLCSRHRAYYLHYCRYCGWKLRMYRSIERGHCAMPGCIKCAKEDGTYGLTLQELGRNFKL